LRGVVWRRLRGTRGADDGECPAVFRDLGYPDLGHHEIHEPHEKVGNEEGRPLTGLSAFVSLVVSLRPRRTSGRRAPRVR
jgi:hypothetical protein